MGWFRNRIAAARAGEPSSSAMGSAGSSPLGWRVSALATLVLAGVFLVACLGRLVVLIRDRQLVDRIVADPNSVPIHEGIDSARAESTINVWVVLTGFVVVVAFVLFYVKSRRLIRRLGCDVHTAMWHWSVAAWQIGVSLSVLWAYFGRPLRAIPDQMRAEAWQNLGRALAWHSADRERILFAAVMVVVQTLFVVTIWVRRKRISAMITNPSAVGGVVGV